MYAVSGADAVIAVLVHVEGMGKFYGLHCEERI